MTKETSNDQLTELYKYMSVNPVAQIINDNKFQVIIEHLQETGEQEILLLIATLDQEQQQVLDDFKETLKTVDSKSEAEKALDKYKEARGQADEKLLEEIDKYNEELAQGTEIELDEILEKLEVLYGLAKSFEASEAVFDQILEKQLAMYFGGAVDKLSRVGDAIAKKLNEQGRYVVGYDAELIAGLGSKVYGHDKDSRAVVNGASGEKIALILDDIVNELKTKEKGLLSSISEIFESKIEALSGKKAQQDKHKKEFQKRFEDFIYQRCEEGSSVQASHIKVAVDYGIIDMEQEQQIDILSDLKERGTVKKGLKSSESKFLLSTRGLEVVKHEAESLLKIKSEVDKLRKSF